MTFLRAFPALWFAGSTIALPAASRDTTCPVGAFPCETARPDRPVRKSRRKSVEQEHRHRAARRRPRWSRADRLPVGSSMGGGERPTGARRRRARPLACRCPGGPGAGMPGAAPAGGGGMEVASSGSRCSSRSSARIRRTPGSTPARQRLLRHESAAEGRRGLRARPRDPAREPGRPCWTRASCTGRSASSTRRSRTSARRTRRTRATCRAFFNLGVVYAYDLKQPKKAIEAWEKVVATDPSSAQAIQARTQLQQLKTAQ